MKPEDKIIVALDTHDLNHAKALMDQLQGVISYFKIGMEFFYAFGWQAVDMIRQRNAKVFLDLKLHDIPNTVSQAVKVLCQHHVDMVNVHALGGYEMMRQAADVIKENVKVDTLPTKLIAVTILTSHHENDLKTELGISKKLTEQVLDLANLAQKAGLDGVVSSPHEIKALRKGLPENFLIVTPGIRPANFHAGDQKRIMTPKEAIESGANHIVIGRPIVQAKNPRQSALEIIQSIKD